MVKRFFKARGNERMNAAKLGILGAFIVGIVHGIGAETPTQVMLLSTTAGLSNLLASLLSLVLFVVGLLISTLFITVIASWGFLRAKFRRKMYLLLGTITGSYSVYLGITILNGM
jgi:high-affinity nickel-transport protein